ncbi:MAG TPA: hypothetical protein VKK79_25835 [Candidatus Lokiarchaeia archaeon]|nr:hypothetical protein [Candidatus Lokiarchaeia archaeon]
MPTFAPISPEDFVARIHTFIREKVAGSSPQSVAEMTEQVLGYGKYKHLTPQVSEDLEVVRFDNENETAGPQGFNNADPSIMGVQVHPETGMPFLGVTAGGDWELPVYFILFFDGTQLRGYIPRAGNIFNEATMTAYGSEQESTVPGVSEFGNREADWDESRAAAGKRAFDPAVILADIARNIVME